MPSWVSVLVGQSQAPEPERPLIFLNTALSRQLLPAKEVPAFLRLESPWAHSQLLSHLPSWSGTIREIGGDGVETLVPPAPESIYKLSQGYVLVGGGAVYF